MRTSISSRRLARIVLAIVVIGWACVPPPEPASAPRRVVHTRFDSLEEAQARSHSAEWRAAHYMTPDFHGPFRRPTLPDGADTNDPVAYYRLADSIEWREQGTADRALYWAIRLDPTMADAYFERWDLRTHGGSHFLYPDDSLRLRQDPPPNEKAALDSLRTSAFMHNPFLDEALAIPPEIMHMRQHDAERDARTAGLWWYARGDYVRATNEFGKAIRKDPKSAGFHFPRAFAWVHLKQNDSAIADLRALIERIQQIQDSIVLPYLSKDRLYYAIGVLRAEQKRFPEARAAYESTLVENLGFYMAHVRLSAVALLLHDTTTALNELETATMIRGDDPVLLTFRGSILNSSHRYKEAERDLRAAVHADTDYALPYVFLGQAAEGQQDTAAAVSRYREYLARASRAASERAWVEGRLERMNASRE